MLAGRARTEHQSARFLASAGRSARRLRPFGALLRIDMPTCDIRRRTQVEVWSLLVWCRGWSPRSGCFRDRGWAGCARFDGPGCFSTPQLDKRSLGSARDGRFVIFRLYFERGRGTPQRARLVRSALVGGEEKKWRSRVKVKSRTRALALLVLVRGSARQTAARQNARHRRIFVQ